MVSDVFGETLLNKTRINENRTLFSDSLNINYENQ